MHTLDDHLQLAVPHGEGSSVGRVALDDPAHIRSGGVDRPVYRDVVQIVYAILS